MTRIERFKFYEKLYFHEIERRERISARLTVPLGAIVATAGLLSFLLNSKERPGEPLYFWIFFGGAAIALLSGAWFFRGAWFGHTDKLLPSAEQVENYYQLLGETYKEYDDSDRLANENFEKFLFDYFIRSSSANAVNNDRRSYNIYRAGYALTIAVLLALAAAVPFYLL